MYNDESFRVLIKSVFLICFEPECLEILKVNVNKRNSNEIKFKTRILEQLDDHFLICLIYSQR